MLWPYGHINTIMGKSMEYLNMIKFETNIFKNMLIGLSKDDNNKQSVPLNLVCVLSFREKVKEEKGTKVVPCKWYSEVKYQVKC